MRTGALTDAIAYCIESGHNMRAVALKGYEFTMKVLKSESGDPDIVHAPVQSEFPPDSRRQARPVPDFIVTGNCKRDMWKMITWEICEMNKLGKYDRAALGSVCGHRQSMLDVANSWHDYVCIIILNLKLSSFANNLGIFY